LSEALKTSKEPSVVLTTMYFCCNDHLNLSEALKTSNLLGGDKSRQVKKYIFNAKIKKHCFFQFIFNFPSHAAVFSKFVTVTDSP
jgi:hypothetical protein